MIYLLLLQIFTTFTMFLIDLCGLELFFQLSISLYSTLVQCKFGKKTYFNVPSPVRPIS
ncbi:putative integral membrane protein [Theileria parva strain Muguga]|uniref:putative integral membrane protein n=1 Tax=Theileria parva strain Muguga TaxID=333668 RepID=UPI001C61751E|nr:putative integral membrane protein [Theileria parva strain Muguga]KAF5153173.1 putative integral membrane protein [Theileria parva strain Muguga]